MVLASMTARVESPPQAGTPYVVVGTMVRSEGRKTWTASAMYDDRRPLVAQAQHLWIAIDWAVVRQLPGRLTQTGSRAIGQDMHRGPPRPEPSSEPAIATTSMPASSSRALVSVFRS